MPNLALPASPPPGSLRRLREEERRLHPVLHHNPTNHELTKQSFCRHQAALTIQRAFRSSKDSCYPMGEHRSTWNVPPQCRRPARDRGAALARKWLTLTQQSSENGEAFFLFQWRRETNLGPQLGGTAQPASYSGPSEPMGPGAVDAARCKGGKPQLLSKSSLFRKGTLSYCKERVGLCHHCAPLSKDRKSVV